MMKYWMLMVAAAFALCPLCAQDLSQEAPGYCNHPGQIDPIEGRVFCNRDPATETDSSSSFDEDEVVPDANVNPDVE